MSGAVRLLAAVASFVAVAAVGGCGERAQTSATRKADAAPYAAANGGGVAYATGQWAAGDEAAWNRQIATRMQGQNEYVRTGTPGAQPAALRGGGMAFASPTGMAPGTAGAAGAATSASGVAAAVMPSTTSATVAPAASAAPITQAASR